MKIRVHSLILGSGFLIWGASMWFILAFLDVLFSGFTTLPFWLTATLAVRPFGSFCLAVTLGTLVVLKDLRFGPWLSWIFLAIYLALSTASTALILWLPPLRGISRIH